MFIGADHAGFALKQMIAKRLNKSFHVEDLGNKAYDANDDYPDVALRVGRAVVKNKSVGILVCGSAQGMCIAANKIRGVRAVVVNNLREALLTREHNDANILCLSGWNLKSSRALKLIGLFLRTPFTNNTRHVRRIKKIAALEHHA